MSRTLKIKHKLRIDSKHQIVCDGDYFPTYTVVIHGTPINYSKVGNGAPLILVHGWSGAWYGWVRTSKYLRDTHTVYMLDLPGFGRSGELEHYSVEKAADYLAGFIQKLKLKPEAVIGLSMSAFVTAQLAKKHPKLIKRAVLLGPVFKAKRRIRASHIITSTFFMMIRDKNRLERYIKAGFDMRIVAQLLAKSLGMYEYKRELVDEYSILSRSRMTRKAFIDMYISITKINIERLLENSKVPTNLIFGSHDKLTNAQQAQEIMKHSKGTFSYASIPRAGHVVSTERPDKVAAEILRFMADVR